MKRYGIDSNFIKLKEWETGKEMYVNIDSVIAMFPESNEVLISQLNDGNRIKLDGESMARLINKAVYGRENTREIPEI